KFVGEFDLVKYFLRRRLFQWSRLLVLARLLQVRTLGGTVERELTLFTTALRIDTSMDCQAEAFFLSRTANRAAQWWYSRGQLIGPNLPLWQLHQRGGSPHPHGQWLSEHGLWKNRIKYGENASHSHEVGCNIRSTFQGGFTNGNRHDQDPARPPHGREERNEQQTSCRVPRVVRGTGNQRDQEERLICGTGSGPSGEVESQSTHGSQSANRRSDQDSCQGRGEVPRGQGRQRLHRPQEVAPCFSKRRPAACRPFAFQLSVVSFSVTRTDFESVYPGGAPL